MDLTIYDNQHLVADKHLELAHKLFEYGAQKINLPTDTEASITFCTAEEIHKINLEYRQTDRPTDVISFALEDGDDDGINTLELEQEFGVPRNIGDLFICPEVVKNHAQEYGHSFEREFGYTVVHGLLHLSGYDHIQEAEAQEMFALQKEILNEFGLKR
ncbi:MAG: rRNA maturation RNase YbeY [Lactobacillus sp.]|uniref:Endoribonuclease YbeY n=1 Tax=Bombilactobacillus bombi TaxID=1303590 RepID=A0A3R6VG53_9LACO|nr:rRNA maturation RNase YbeY [Bombilactobacillus bombi]MCO6542184.1 rRNA maturation RNase YbeY [Lactobacillus sp.]RHW46032.1 rRNA maturation RNase YbeY [Bombilactobacillus bombi]